MRRDRSRIGLGSGLPACPYPGWLETPTPLSAAAPFWDGVHFSSTNPGDPILAHRMWRASCCVIPKLGGKALKSPPSLLRASSWKLVITQASDSLAPTTR